MEILIKWGFTFFAAFLISACVYVPRINESNLDSSDCKTITKDMSLEVIEVHGNISYGCQNEECLATALATAAVVTTGSAIISGSIVLTGKTIHWLEYQGVCSDGYLNKTKQLFLDSLVKVKSSK